MAEKWESLHLEIDEVNGVADGTQRIKVEGGYIYRNVITTHDRLSLALVFVPYEPKAPIPIGEHLRGRR